jgi:deferrochelatase/peroxidase EfeB
MFDIADVQGNILRGYRKPRVRHLILEILDRDAARRWLAAATSGQSDGVPQITTGDWGADKPDTCFNIGLTYEGLRALGTAESSLASFPNEFVQGMNARALKLGDVGASVPQTWPSPFNQPKRIHLIATIYAEQSEELDQVQQRALADNRAFRLLGTREGCSFPEDRVHFGYRDNITQPRFEEIHDRTRYPDHQPRAPLGTVLLGHPTNLEGLMWQVPQPTTLGYNGAFNAFRVLEQDVVAFEKYLDRAASELIDHPHIDELLPPGAHEKIGSGFSAAGRSLEGLSGKNLPDSNASRLAALREVVAANLCGRWRDGTPLALSPDAPDPGVSQTNFDYDAATRCPYGAHIRRCNPRGGQIVQRVANNSRRLVRRGVPYGPAYEQASAAASCQPERGLLGNFIGANLGAQFEALSCDWMNLGLQDPRITGSNDPIAGANDQDSGWFDLPLKSGETIRLQGLPRFVRTRGGAYTFLPSLSAIRFLGSPLT